MDFIQIEGGNPLNGTITINGAKNAVLPLMVVSLLTDQSVSLEQVPQLMDVQSMKHVLESLGTEIHCFHKRFVLTTKEISSWCAHYDLVRKMRASFLVLGALLGRVGRAQVSLPGGCALGSRGVNLHLDGMRALGADVQIMNGYVVAQAPAGGLRGNRFCFSQVSVTGTINLILAAVLTKGETCLENIACEPEVKDVIVCLQKMGAVIEEKGRTLYIQGTENLKGTHHLVLPDRIEMGTYIIAAALTKGQLLLENCPLSLLPTTTDVLRDSGIVLEDMGENKIKVTAPDTLSPFHICTTPYPGIPTDLQAQLMTLACLADGPSTIIETIFENRFMHVPELTRMGANIALSGNKAVIYPVEHLLGAPVMATDLRASVSLVLAALAAHGTSTIRRVYHLDRGYEAVEEKLSLCGAKISRKTDEFAETKEYKVAEVS